MPSRLSGEKIGDRARDWREIRVEVVGNDNNGVVLVLGILYNRNKSRPDLITAKCCNIKATSKVRSIKILRKRVKSHDYNVGRHYIDSPHHFNRTYLL